VAVYRWPMRHSGVWRVGAAAVAAVIVAEAGVWLLRPREPQIEPVSVAESDYFTDAQLERARDYQSGQRALLVATIALQGGILVLLALGRPRSVRRRLDALGARPLLGAAAAGAAIALTLTLVALPPRVVAHERAVDVGLSTQGIGAWLGDQAKSAAIGAALAAAGAALLIALLRRFGRLWWIPATGAVIAIEVVFVWLAPVVLAPIFNRFEELPPGKARSAVLELGRRARVDIGEVYRVDASRRSTSLNAYVDGIGPTKRVVLYDNLLKGVERPALRSVVAHELGHVDHRDILRGMTWVALAAPLALLFTGMLASRLARRTDADLATPAGLPALALALALTSFVLGIIGNQLSREIEASADTFALELTNDPDALIDLQRRLAVANVADPDPPGIVTELLRTHPPTIDRIGAAEAWKRGERP
jgi:Zn-dependent protease with chaperone function